MGKLKHPTEKCLNIVCIIFQVVCFITGIVILGLGIWASLDDQLSRLVDDVMFAGVYIMIAAGALIILTSFLGLYACRAESKPAVVIYSIVALIAIFLKVIGCIIIFDFFITAHWDLVDSYKEQYGNDTKVTEVWDQIQQGGECCGLLQYWDWEESAYYAANNTYPHSCCIREGGEPKHLEHCQLGREGYIHSEGCEYTLERYYYGIGGTAVGVIILELCSVVLLACLYQYYP